MGAIILIATNMQCLLRSPLLTWADSMYLIEESTTGTAGDVQSAEAHFLLEFCSCSSFFVSFLSCLVMAFKMSHCHMGLLHFLVSSGLYCYPMGTN